MNDLFETPTDDWTLGEVKAWLRARVDGGASCPCCTQFAKVYRRRINSGMARALLQQYREAGTMLVHTRSMWLPWSKEAAQLQWWGLINELPERREDGGKAGWWRITAMGEAFALNKIAVPKYARVYDSRVLGLDGTEQATIRECMGAQFNYRDLMDGV